MSRAYKFAIQISVIVVVGTIFFISKFDRVNQLSSKKLENQIYLENFRFKKELNFDAKELADGAYADKLTNDSILIDSVLTIVRNYYVDESRINCVDLMKSALKNLARYDFLQVSFEKEKYAYLRSKKHEMRVNLSDSYSFTNLVSDSLTISKFLDLDDHLISERKLRSGVHIFLESLLTSLDPHSNLLNVDEYRDLRQGTNGSFGGLGIVVGLKDNILTVIKPISRSTAARAGVLKADKILKIDGKKVKEVIVEEESSEISMSTLIVDGGGNFNQQSLSNALKKASDNLVTKLFETN